MYYNTDSQLFNRKYTCFVCGGNVSYDEYKFCTDRGCFFNKILCYKCQDIYRKYYEYGTPPYAMRLQKELKSRGIYSELEKEVVAGSIRIHIDLAIPQAGLNLEIDGIQHSSKRQAISDLSRTYYCMEKGYTTIRVPNSVFKDDESISTAADIIKKMVYLP